MKRSVFFISDRTGITAETLGNSLLTQFDAIEFDKKSLPFVDTLEKAHQSCELVKETYQQSGIKPLIFSSIVNAEIRAIIAESDAMVMDFFNTFLEPMEGELGTKSNHHIGRSHGMHNYDNYKNRIDAVNFALSNDDGVGTHNYQHADIILIGVSRCGKTPSCLYLALQYSIMAANYPMTEENFENMTLPKDLLKYKNKIFGLTIDPNRLHAIREERRPGSPYASLKRCQQEVADSAELFVRHRIPYLSTTSSSIEEIATKIMVQAGLKRG